MVFDYSLLIRLVVAALLGGIIGFERGGSNHEAGLRTHIILCLGASMIAVLSELMVKQYGINSEVMRMSAQVISGVGFLGAGSIIMDGNRIRGITTAAGLWTTAGLVLQWEAETIFGHCNGCVDAFRNFRLKIHNNQAKAKLLPYQSKDFGQGSA